MAKENKGPEELEDDVLETEPAAEQEEPGDQAEEAPGTGEPSAAGEGDDKFMQATRKATAWVEKGIGSAYKSARGAADSGRFKPRAGIEKLDKLLDWVRERAPEEAFQSLSAWCVRYGHTGLMVAEVLCLLMGVVAAIKLGSWVYLVHGAGLAVLLLILQYTADKFLHAGEALVEASPSRLGSGAFLDCLCLLSGAAGILIMVSYVMLARQSGQWSLLWAGLGAWALCDAIGYIALNPSMANIEIDENVRAGEEAIGIMSFLVKAVVRIVPIAFGIGAIIGVLGLLFGTFSLMGSGQLLAAHASLRLIVLCACLPFFSYVLFAFYHLVIDLMRAILVLPGKLDKE